MASIIAVEAVVVGLAIGSFLNVVIYRLPRGYSVVKPRSFCPNCRKVIPWYENIPLFSYVVLRGKCSSCGARIPIRYPVVELLSALTALGIYLEYGLKVDSFFIYAFLMALLAVTIIDWNHRIIPDEISLPFILIGIAWSFVSPEKSPSHAALGAISGGGGLFLVGYLYKLVRHTEGMGGGDVKLMAMIGAFLGIRLILPVILIASLAGSIYGIAIMRKGASSKATVAFGSFLAPAAAFCLLYGNELLEYYFSRF